MYSAVQFSNDHPLFGWQMIISCIFLQGSEFQEKKPRRLLLGLCREPRSTRLQLCTSLRAASTKPTTDYTSLFPSIWAVVWWWTPSSMWIEQFPTITLCALAHADPVEKNRTQETHGQAITTGNKVLGGMCISARVSKVWRQHPNSH